ncbi:MAG TPA: cyclic nucleotide-binding domain-containing protein [Candidatus Limnocylindrales bacterium]
MSDQSAQPADRQVVASDPPVTPTDLGQLPLFDGVPDAELLILAASASRVVYADGETIFEEGDPATTVMSILRGQIVLRSAYGDRSTIVQTIGPGELLGWSALRDEATTLTSARAIGQVEVLAFPAERLLDLLAAGGVTGRLLIRRLIGIATTHLQETRRQLLRAGREGVITAG